MNGVSGNAILKVSSSALPGVFYEIAEELRER